MAGENLIKVRVDMTLTIDLDDYRLNYGNDDLATIRRDVRAACVDAANSGGVLASGIVAANLVATHVEKPRRTALDIAREKVEHEKLWIKEHGGGLAGYVERYGPADGDPTKPLNEGGRYGLGGPAIYEADRAALAEYELEYEALGGDLRAL